MQFSNQIRTYPSLCEIVSFGLPEQGIFTVDRVKYPSRYQRCRSGVPGHFSIFPSGLTGF